MDDEKRMLIRHFIDAAHDRAVNGAVNSDGEGNIDTCDTEEYDEPRHEDPNSPPACVADGNTACACGECDYKHYISRVAKQPELSGQAFTTHPCNLPLGNIAFKPAPKNKQTSPIYQVVYEGPTDLSIRLVMEWPDFDIVSYKNTLSGKDKGEASFVCRLQLHSMIEEKIPKHEAVTLRHTLNRLEEKYADFLTSTYPDSIFEMTHFMSERGCMYLPLDPYRRATGAPGKAKIEEIIAQYLALETSHKLMHIRVGFGWMHPKEEDPTHRSFRAGIKYYLCAPLPISPLLIACVSPAWKSA
jgi:hypothetical protein